jgi:glutathione S-transferase
VNYTRDPVEQGIVFPLLRGEAGTHPDRLKAASLTALESIRWLETILAAQDYLAGNERTAADINAMPIIQMLRRVGQRQDAVSLGLRLDNLASSHPAISAWLQRLEKMPGYNAAFPPHWRT